MPWLADFLARPGSGRWIYTILAIIARWDDEANRWVPLRAHQAQEPVDWEAAVVSYMTYVGKSWVPPHPLP